MADIFSNTASTLAGVFAAHQAVLNMAGVNIALVQNLNFTHMQSFTRLYEIGSQGNVGRVFYVTGRTQGIGNMGRVVGPKAALAAFYAKFGDVCEAKQNTVDYLITPG